MTAAKPTCGFVYVATGARYVAEACASAATLRAAMPSARVALITDAPPTDPAGLFSPVVVRTDVQHRPVDKLLCLAAPFDRCVFLDTDTHVSGDLSGLFDLLEAFDLAAAPETLRGWHYKLPGIPDAFAEYNTGVIAFRRNAAVASFFGAWRQDYDKLHSSHGFVSDQPAFRSAAFRSVARLAPLPSEYHFITSTPNYTMWQVRLLHGRGDLGRDAAELNRRPGARAHVPGLGAISAFQGHGHWLRQCLRLMMRCVQVPLAALFRSGGSAPRSHWTGEEKSLTESRRDPKP